MSPGLIRIVYFRNSSRISRALSAPVIKSNRLIQTSCSSRKTSQTNITFESTTHRIDHESSFDSKHPKDPLDLTFSNTKEAYKSKKTSELLRAFFVLKLCTFDYLIENNAKLIKLGRTILGANLFRLVMKSTFYGQFVAGEDEVAIRPTIALLKSFGVKTILDYGAEEDISEEQAVSAEMASVPKSDFIEEKAELKQFKPQKEFADRRKFKAKARTYFYLNEAQCERNMDTFLKCIDTVSGVTEQTGLAAIKLTALGRPQILLQLSEVIARTRMLSKEITGQEKIALSNVSPQEFQVKYDQRFNFKTDIKEVKDWFKNMDSDKRGLMNLFSWNGLVDMQVLVSDLFKVPNLKSGKMESIITALSREEEEMFRNMMRRIHLIAKSAQERDVRVMIDAEQSYFQPAINRITMELMRKYNKEKAIVFNTYQCYLKNAFDCVTLDLELARRQNIFFGAKLVRGAYMEQERERALKVGYDDPINSSFENTTNMYHKTLSEVMKQIVETGIENKRIAIMVASHNEDTVRFTVQKMEELGIRPEHKVICFGQLYGMCDQISFPLGQSGYSVYKYVPYGKVDEVIPYLSRRGAENHGVLGKVLREISLLRSEILRRLFTGEIFHKPDGKYVPV